MVLDPFRLEDVASHPKVDRYSHTGQAASPSALGRFNQIDDSQSGYVAAPRVARDDDLVEIRFDAFGDGLGVSIRS